MLVLVGVPEPQIGRQFQHEDFNSSRSSRSNNFLTMNGSFGGAAFDFGDAFAGFSNGDGQDQHQQPQPNHYLQNSGHFDQFDAGLRNPALFAGLQYNQTYNSTPSTHHAYHAAPQVGGGMGDSSLQHQMNNSTVHMISHQQQFMAPSPSFYQLDAIQSSLQAPEKLLAPDKLLSTTSQMTFPHVGLFPDPNRSGSKRADAAHKANPDQWLETMKISCPDVSLDPLSGAEILKRVRSKTDNVVTSYLPCVEFLVSCQQELRAGLAAATQKRIVRQAYRDSMTPRQFYLRFLEPLPNRFFDRNKTLMETSTLNKAVEEIQKLCADSKRIEYQGCEAMKNAFLGGMKDGESWGLRKWLSKHGGALHICNDLECILRSCQALDRSHDTTRKLSERLRPLAKQALERLKNDVPASYQEVSTAHPYLPFFHRLESALKGMSGFDPEDDDVICIDDDDDDEIEEIRVKPQPQPMKRKAEAQTLPKQKKYKTMEESFLDLKRPAKNDDEDSSVIEIIDMKGPAQSDDFQKFPGASTFTTLANRSSVDANGDLECPRCTMLNAPEARRCCMCDQAIDVAVASDENDDDNTTGFGDFAFDDPSWDAQKMQGGSVSPLLVQMGMTSVMDVPQMLQAVEKIAVAADSHQHRSLRPRGISFDDSFWNLGPQFAAALRILANILGNRDAHSFVDPPDEAAYLIMGRPVYTSIIKHPICIRDIVTALVGSGGEGGSGVLPLKSLSCWNMWRGMDLLQALDLVLLNSLAYNGKEKTKERSTTNRLRRLLWEGINVIITEHVGGDMEKRRQFTPTRRGENSGFVVQK